MAATELQTDGRGDAPEADAADKHIGANTGSGIPNDEGKATEAVAKASLEVLKQASKILVPPTL